MRIERNEGYIAVQGDFKVLSSAVYNGGYTTATEIVNLKVRSDFTGDALELFNSFIKEKELEGKGVVGMMTAVPMENARIVKKEDVTAIITAGISESKSSSTVNIILLIDKDLSPSAMANTIILATEAKTAAFFDLDIKDEKHDIFTGNSTDSVVVACYGKSLFAEEKEEEMFAGKATKLGRTIYEIVREGVKDALFYHNKIKADRPILERLEERGITLEDMISAALELYIPRQGEKEDMAKLKERLEAMIKKECSDVNIALLLASALHVEEEEIIKGKAGRAGEEDAVNIVADELIGIDIAEYIGGKKALFNFFYYDTRKPGLLSRLGVSMDDAIGGLIAGCMSKMLG
jgi:alpha-ribazole phosphatase CobZ